MRTFAVLLLATAAAAQTPGPANTQPAAPTTTATTVQDPSARKARDLVDKMIAAMGGQAFLTFQTKTEEGRSYGFYHGQSQGVGTLYWRFWKWPDKDRTEFTKKRDIAIIHNGEQGAEVTYKGVAFEDPETLEPYQRRRPFSVEHIVREWINNPGVIYLYEGTAVADQKLVHQVSLINEKNQQVSLFIDANSNLLVKKTFTWRDPRYKDKNEEAEIFGNFRLIQGVQTPLSYARTLNGEMTSQRFMTKVQYNTPLQENLFDVKATFDPYKRDRNTPK